MNPYIKLGAAALLPVAASVLLYLLERKTAFGQLKYGIRQAIIGILFGGLAIFGTEFGIVVLGVTMNVRDAAPVCAGLIFGAPAGIIAGLIGGIERFFAAWWGAGAYTQIACSVSTAVAGFFAAWLRKYMFDDKKPAWFYGLATGSIAEVLHMLMVFLTNLSDGRNAFLIVKKCAPLMIAFNGISVMLAVLIVSLLAKEHYRLPKEKTKISQTFQRWLLLCVVIAFCLTSGFTYALQDGIARSQARELLLLNAQDVKKDVTDLSDENLLRVARAVANQIDKGGQYDTASLRLLGSFYDVSEVSIIDETGTIIISTQAKFLNYDMASGEQSAEFLVLLDGSTAEYVQDYQGTSYDSTIFRKYAGVALASGGFVQVGYDGQRFHRDIATQVDDAARNRHVGENGFIIICDTDLNIVSDLHGHTGAKLDVTGIDLDLSAPEPEAFFETKVYGEDCCCVYTDTEGYYILAVLPIAEAMGSRDLSFYITVFMEVLIFTALFILIYFLIKRLIVDNIRRVNQSLAEITGGNLDTTVNVRSSSEFASLSDDINATVITLRHYIDEAAARIDKELALAKNIQVSALPGVFPPYPNRTEFDIWAGMTPAKEVGGDFYDFYMLGEDKLVFLVADVSGKGIPAAMFMMTAKTMIKSYMESGEDVQDAFTHANNGLCENNEAGMFVTAWMGVLDLRSGLVTFANAGHNPPLVRHGDGSFEYLRARAGFVLAGMEGMRYRKNELQLQSGDTIFLYTDGVTEATDVHTQLYGEERLQKRISEIRDTDSEGLCRLIREDVDAFVGEAPQFDDITMLALTFKKPMGDA